MKNNNIYIIDDNEAVCDSLELLSSYFQLNVTVYHNPLLFLEEFSPKLEGCLIVDLFMPYMNGVDLTKELRKSNKQLKIIIMSGHGTDDAASASMLAGANKFIAKPFKTDYLLKNIMMLLQS